MSEGSREDMSNNKFTLLLTFTIATGTCVSSMNGTPAWYWVSSQPEA